MNNKKGSAELPQCIVLLFILYSLFLTSSSIQAQNGDLSVISRWTMYTDCKNSLYQYLYSVACRQLDLREKEIAGLTTKDQWLQRQLKVKNILSKIIGPFPDKTPLNARINGTVQKQGYRIEKIIYESTPSYYVTACLFLPDIRKDKTPASPEDAGDTSSGWPGFDLSQEKHFSGLGEIFSADLDKIDACAD